MLDDVKTSPPFCRLPPTDNQTLLHFIFQNVLLLYYAQWCGFCASLNHIFIQLARLLPPDSFTVAR